MDPNKTMKMIVEYLNAKDYRLAIESAQDLLERLKKGGFLPTGWIAETDSTLLVTVIESWFVQHFRSNLMEAGENRQLFAEALQAFIVEGAAYVEKRLPPESLDAYRVDLSNLDIESIQELLDNGDLEAAMNAVGGIFESIAKGEPVPEERLEYRLYYDPTAQEYVEMLNLLLDVASTGSSTPNLSEGMAIWMIKQWVQQLYQKKEG